MQFGNRPPSPVPRKPKSRRLLCVGHRAYVNRVPSQQPEAERVPLINEAGMSTMGELVDGQEVEIVAWRQRPHVRYHVRCISSGAEGWMEAECLRATREVPLEASSTDPAPKTPAVRLEGPEVVSAAPARKTRASAARSKAAAAGVGARKGNATVACPVCGKGTHAYNLTRNTKGAVVGCYSCHVRRS